ncbi:carboxypeptidase Q-like [Chironomus tepperi]|uniref:carboxypeptidase Q-like n=1 Tax=Chironomus tepperi TaxID=113505 RepID=UPI00391F7390
MSLWTGKVLFIFISLFIKSALLGVIDNSIEHYSYQSETGDAVCHLPDNLVKEIAGYQDIVNKIIDEITNGRFKGKTWDSLAELTDLFGPRMVCTDALDKAIDYVVESMKKGGLENVHNENVTAPNWVRGFESAQLVKPWKKNMHILGLGSTIGTPRGGIIADVIAVESFDEFNKIPEDQVKGKIVLFVPKWQGYDKTVVYRGNAASRASEKGAVAALVRSITPFSIGSPHTGHQSYADGVKKIPVAAITVEDAEMILRMYRRGQPITIHLEMSDFNKPDCISRNTIGELQGTSKYKDKSVVVVSGHLDSWDVGVGAMDDGGGSMISWKAVEFLKAMNLRPKRTIRAILWTSEEQGMVGAEQYMEAHKATESDEFNFFMESDIGTFDPQGLDFSGNADASCILQEILKLMKSINATQFREPTDGGPDISWWTVRGFPSASLINKNEKYFYFHHSDGDTMAVEDRDVLDKCTALWAAASYVIADLSINMPKNLVSN